MKTIMKNIPILFTIIHRKQDGLPNKMSLENVKIMEMNLFIWTIKKWN